MPQCVRCKRVHNTFLSRFSTIKAQPSIISWNLSHSSFMLFFFLLWHAVHCCRGFHVGDPNERKWAPNKLFDDRSQKHWNECRSCTCGRYFCPPTMCLYSAQCGRIGPSIIDMTTALSFCLDAYVAEPMHYFVCCSSQLTGAAGGGNMMVQLVQRDWRVRLDQKWSRSACSVCWMCTLLLRNGPTRTPLTFVCAPPDSPSL